MLSAVAWISIFAAIACAIWIALDEVRHPQNMDIMNVVWPVSALYFSVIAVWAYYRFGRSKTTAAAQKHTRHSGIAQGGQPSPWQIAVGVSHCGAGCMLADVLCEFAIAATSITLFGSVLWAEYAIYFAAAWALGIAFQYFAIKPMRTSAPAM